jgi:hypothetical protein
MKICECIEVVSKVEISVSNTNEPVPVPVDDISIKLNKLMNVIDKLMDIILKQNKDIEELKQEIKQIIKPIEKQYKYEIDPINIEFGVSDDESVESVVSVESVESVKSIESVVSVVSVEPKKRQRATIMLIEDETDISNNSLMLETEKMKFQLELEKLKNQSETEKMRMQFELQKMKMKTEETSDDIIEKNRYGMINEMSYVRGNPIMEGTIYEITENLDITEKEIISISNSYSEDNDKKNKETKIKVISDKLKKILNNMSEHKRPIIYVKDQLYQRVYYGEEQIYKWEECRIEEIVSNIEHAYALIEHDLRLSSEQSMNFKSIIYDTLVESDLKLVLKSIKSYITCK